ncbi:MAG: hypothetical protein ACFB01_00360 [Cohaesibacteraceae bacterium]
MTRCSGFWSEGRSARRSALVAALAVFALGVPSTASAQLLADYTTRIGPHDKVNSQGDRLDSAAAILRQDRANVHRFNLADDEDETDTYFTTPEARRGFERLMSRGLVRSDTRTAIINGSPLVRVRAYPTRVDVELVEP